MPAGIPVSYLDARTTIANIAISRDVDISGTKGPIIAGFAAVTGASGYYGAITPTTFQITDLDTGRVIASYAIGAGTHGIVVVFGDHEGAGFAVEVTAAGYNLLAAPATGPSAPRPRRLRVEVLAGLGATVFTLIGVTTTPMHQSPAESV